MISIVIPTFNRNELLDLGLSSLDKQQIEYPYEIIVVDEYVNDGVCKHLCKQYKNTKYVSTRPGETKETIKWRVPTAAINIGVKLAKYPILVITGPEIYHINPNTIQNLVEPLLTDKKLMTYTQGFDDRASRILNHIKANGEMDSSDIDSYMKKFLADLNTKMPFCLGVSKDEFVSIGGYDESFLKGYCFDDTDFCHRMELNGCKYHKVPGTIIHLFHPRLRYNLEEVKKLWKINEKLYLDRYQIIVRNKGKEWGVLNGS